MDTITLALVTADATVAVAMTGVIVTARRNLRRFRVEQAAPEAS